MKQSFLRTTVLLITGIVILVVQGIAQTVLPIFDARENDTNGVPKRIDQVVSVKGIVTVSSEFGAPAYMQDGTAGIAVYDFDFANSVDPGDELTITGKIAHYNGLTELVSVTVNDRSGSGRTVEPRIVSIEDLLNEGERYEGMLLRLNGITVNTSAWTVSGSGTNYRLSDGIREVEVRIDNDVDFTGTPAPGGAFDIIGVLSQYSRTPPYSSGYQFMPRGGTDILSTGPGIISVPEITDIRTDGFTVTWRTRVEALPFLRYGKTDTFELGSTGGTQAGFDHSVSIRGLEAGTIYKAQPVVVAGGDTGYAGALYACTSSATSTGEMNVYFNRDVDQSVYPVLPARGNVNLLYKLLDRIEAAQYSIDVCLYSLSGTVGEEIADALLDARDRGVLVRTIFETDNANTNAIRTLRNNVPSIVDNFDPGNAGEGLQHNKFFIFDARDRSSDRDDWLISGSWNPTDPGTNSDAQNVIEIQDQAVAVVYTREFEEMWGSTNETPNSARSRFGAGKSDNTPHVVDVKGTRVEIYFSPTDHTTDYLIRSVRNAQRSVYFSVLTFTRSDLAGEMITGKDRGIAVRGIFDRSSDQGSQYQALKTGGVDVFLKKGIPGMLHHKYMIVDVETDSGSGNPMVLTGSHNWSSAAESRNNENTLGIYSADIARQYVQEWFRRYRDAGGTGSVVLGVEKVLQGRVRLELGQNYPNPVSQSAGTGTSIEIGVREAGEPVYLAIRDLLGREISRPLHCRYGPGLYRVTVDMSNLAPGLYTYVLSDGREYRTRKMIVLE